MCIDRMTELVKAVISCGHWYTQVSVKWLSWHQQPICWFVEIYFSLQFFYFWLYALVFLSIAVYKKAELSKKAEVQAHSPSRKIILKPAIKHTRPTHHSCVKRKQTGDCAVLNLCNVAGKHRYYYSHYYYYYYL